MFLVHAHIKRGTYILVLFVLFKISFHCINDACKSIFFQWVFHLALQPVIEKSRCSVFWVMGILEQKKCNKVQNINSTLVYIPNSAVWIIYPTKNYCFDTKWLWILFCVNHDGISGWVICIEKLVCLNKEHNGKG